MAKKSEDISNICNQFLKGEICMIKAARQLRDYRDDYDIINYNDILLFDKIAYETECFPLGSERKKWNRRALKRKDDLKKVLESHYKIRVNQACKRLISEFDK